MASRSNDLQAFLSHLARFGPEFLEESAAKLDDSDKEILHKAILKYKRDAKAALKAKRGY